MCSILGFIGKNGDLEKELLDLVPTLLKVSKNRGPDVSKIFRLNDRVVFCNNRLAITDPRGIADMPMNSSDDRFTIIFNGEIYNYQALRKELRNLGYSFATDSDTEVLLNAYIAWGENCLEKLDGMFAVAIWDNKKNKLFLGRDRFGIKPLYYFDDEHYIIFSSDIRVFADLPFIKKEINPSALTAYASLRYIVGPDTIFKSVKRLDLAEKLTWSKEQQTKIDKYWKPQFLINPNASADEMSVKLYGHYRDAVELMLMGNYTPAVLLSGGIDSCSILYALKDLGLNNIDTYSCRYVGTNSYYNADKRVTFIQSGYDETSAALSASKHFGTNHNLVEIGESDMEKNFESMVSDLGEPHSSTDAFGHYMLAKEVGKHTKVVLAGIGSDELLGGYINLYYGQGGRYLKNRMPAVDHLKIYSNLDDPNSNMSNCINADYRQEDYIKQYITRAMHSCIHPEMQNEGVNEHVCFEIHTDLCGWELEQADRVYMASSVEARPVFLENKLVDYILSIPSKYKYHNQIEKWILKNTFQNKLPSSVINRPKFPSLGIPASWYLKPWFQDRLNHFLNYPSPYWNMEFIKQRKDDIETMYRFVVFETWYQKLLSNSF